MASVCISRRCFWSDMAALIYSTKGRRVFVAGLFFCNDVWAAGSDFGSLIDQFLLLTVPNHGLGSHPCRVVSSSYQKKMHCHGKRSNRLCESEPLSALVFMNIASTLE